jgi:hypothetical protein
MMAPHEAGLFLALCFGADELGTHTMLRAGGRETMIQRPAIRIGIKAATIPLYLKYQKKSKVVRFGFPVVFLAAGAWNLHVAKTMNDRTKGRP